MNATLCLHSHEKSSDLDFLGQMLRISFEKLHVQTLTISYVTLRYLSVKYTDRTLVKIFR